MGKLTINITAVSGDTAVNSDQAASLSGTLRQALWFPIGLRVKLYLARENMMKRNLIWMAVVAIAAPIALSGINVQAQEPDDLPRLGETTTEYNLRMARTRKDRDALREALRDAQDKA